MWIKRSSLVFAVVFPSLVNATYAQDRALVLLRPEAASDMCAPGGDPKLLTVFDYKIQRQDEVRLALGLTSARASITRDEFNKMKKLKLKELVQLETKDGLIYVTAGDGQQIPAVPDVEPARNAQISLSQYMEMILDGETRDGRTKQRQAIPVKSIWKVFVLTPSLTEAEALFRHANQEKSVGSWTFFLGKASSYKVKQAGDGLAQSTTGCIDRAMERFRAGSFQAIDEAKDHGQKLMAMSSGSGPASDRLAAIRKEEQDVRDRIRTGMQLMGDQKWDDALAAWEPITKYVKDPSLKDFGEAYAATVTNSHDSHLAAANAALRGAKVTYESGSDTPFRRALQEFEKSLALVPNSDQARRGRREMLIVIALIEARRFRTANDPGSARDVLVKAGKENGNDERISAELTEANCELGTQLLAQARALATVTVAAPGARSVSPGTTASPRPGTQRGSANASGSSIYKVRGIQTTSEKRAFLDARKKLMQAVDLCQADEKNKLLADVNAALADYHVAQARKAITRKLFATALLNLNAARMYRPDRSDLDDLTGQVREPVQQKAQIQAGVVISSISNDCAEAAQQVAGAVESALIGGEAVNVQLLARDQAQGILRQMRSGIATGTNQAIISGQIAACTFNVTSQRRQVSSKLEFENPTYKQLKDAAEQASQEYDQCRRSYTETACANARNNRDQIQNRLAREQPFIYRDYSYEEQPFTATGQMRLTLQIDDSILRGTRSVGEAAAALNDSCLARRGVRDNDWGRNTDTAESTTAGSGSGWRGLVQGLVSGLTTSQRGQIPPNVECPNVPRATRLSEMAEQVTTQAKTQASAAIRNVAQSYLELAKRATDQDIAVENYITFAILTADKTGADFQQALTAIHARDADLHPETALR